MDAAVTLRVEADTRRWLERAVVGLNLCPFAKAVYMKRQVHFSVSAARDTREALAAVGVEVDALAAADPAVRDTTLLMFPACLDDFLEFNDFLEQAERLVRKRGLEGVLQVASFHPDYRFADAAEGDVSNCTNRSPYPTVHLLREASIDRAVRAFPEAEAIYTANIETMRRLGWAGWLALGVRRGT